MSQRLTIGMPLRESLLAKQFCVKRGAMREALCQAVGWGLVEYVSFCGFRIRDFTLADFRDWLELRDAVESTSAGKLARSYTPEIVEKLSTILRQSREAMASGDHNRFNELDADFHLSIIQACGNHKFCSPAIFCYIAVTMRLECQNITRLAEKCEEYARLDPFMPRNLDRDSYLIYNEEQCCIRHQDIYTAISNGEVNEAEHLIHSHVRHGIRGIEMLICRYGADTPLSTPIADSRKLS